MTNSNSKKYTPSNFQTDQLTNYKGIYRRFLKRPLDLILSLFAIIILSPVLLIVALMVRVKLGSPVLFKQKRPGLHENLFTMYKFRTMTDERDENGKLLSDRIRLPKFGKFLRSTSLDELPELFNIVRGDMSIVGPRPQLVRDRVFMTSEQRHRHDVCPGLSGLAQINGRNNLTWEKKFEYDLQYIKNITIIGDIKIILVTVGKVVKRRDTVREGTVSDMDFGDWLLFEGKIDHSTYYDKQEEAKELMKD